MFVMHDELVAIFAVIEPAERRERLVRAVGRVVGVSMRDGHDLEWVAAELDQRARHEADGPDADVWRQVADLYARWQDAT